MNRSRSCPMLLALAAAVSPALASAQSAGETFAINRYNPSERGSDWFANESLDLRGHWRPALGLVGDLAYKPLVMYDANGDELSAIVRYQAYAHLGGGVILWDRVRLAASAPVLAYSQGERQTTTGGTFSSEDGTSFGDLRIGADVRLLGTYGGLLTVAAGAQLHLPTGNQDAYAGDGSARLQPRVLAAGDISVFTYAGQLSFNYRPNQGRVNGTPFGNEFTFAAAAGLRLLDHRLIVGPEVYGSTVVSAGGAAWERRTTPVEVVMGAKYWVTKDLKVGVGFGPGLTRGLGSPTMRWLASVEWMPEIAPSDRDKDTILDVNDACPDEPGLPNADPKKHGCPPQDRDGDTIFDDNDACPDEPGPANADPAKNGCPLRDRDGDKILDADDACPDQPGPANADPKKHGCPLLDRDKDGILDADDACPDEPGVAHSDPKRHGCPLLRIDESEIVIYERVEFEFDSDVLLAQSDRILGAVFEVLKGHPEFTKVSVEGHTDKEGTETYNQALSERRAAAVVKWLADHGIAPGRLQSRGFGEMRPRDTNETELGRKNNRRVEFIILERDGQPVPRFDSTMKKDK